MEITYQSNKKLTYNMSLLPKETTKQPEYKISDLGYTHYLLIMYEMKYSGDIDAPSGNYWHWIVHIDNTRNKHTTLLPYVGAMPTDTKVHHYKFELYGRNEPFTQIPFTQRNLPLNEGKTYLGLDNPILFEMFSIRGSRSKTKKKRKIHNKRKTHNKRNGKSKTRK